MLTSRGWLFAIVILGLLFVAVRSQQIVLFILTMSLGLWFAWEWLLFAVRTRVIARRIVLRRDVCDERGPVESLWAGRTFTVHGEVHLDHWLGLSYAAVVDRFPFDAVPVDGEIHVDGPLMENQPLRFNYRLCCPVVGRLRFEGVRLRLADLQGFFYHVTFVHGVVEYRVLPRLVDASGRPSARKRHNLLPPPGIHRLRRAGSGSELLDLRDYRPGDPPKTIAWKVSARRDRLITKDFESEVPIRCTLFVDSSNSVRVGPAGGNSLSRLIDIASAVTQANSGDRDLTGLCIFDEHRAVPLRPARGQRHLAEVLNRLVDAGAQAPATGGAPLVPLIQLGHAFVEEVYPDLLRSDINSTPFWLPWVARRMGPRRGYRSRLWLYVVALIFPSVVVSLAHFAFMEQAVSLGARLVGFAFSLALCALIFFWPRESKLVRMRKRLAAVVAARYRLAPGGLSVLLDDDEQMAIFVQRFLADHHVPYALPLYDENGRYRFASPQKVNVLAAALLNAVGRGRDNELFVLFADLLEIGDRLTPLLRAVRVALSRHHHVLVVCPWPPGVPAPTADAAQPTFVRRGGLPDVRATLERASIARFHRAYHKLRRMFARMNVPVVSARGEEPVRLILDRMDRLRMLGRRR
jgi:uncharacterized protein (DUF58 family)